MTQYDLEFTIYKDYRNGLPALKGNISRLHKDISKAMTDLMNFISNIFEWNGYLKDAKGGSIKIILNEIDRLTEEKNNFINYINALKQMRKGYVDRLEHPPRIPVPPDEGYEIRNGLIGERDVLLKQTRNPRLTDTDLQNIMGMTARTAGYRNHFLFQNRNLPRPYNEPPPLMDIIYL
jgi:hypothetical protein